MVYFGNPSRKDLGHATNCPEKLVFLFLVFDR